MAFRLRKNDYVEIVCLDQESEAVFCAVSSLKKDLRKVLDAQIDSPSMGAQKKILVGTIGSPALPRLDWERIAPLRKETYYIAEYEGNLLLAGSDRRGVIYAIYEFCEKILGVSPWYFMADVPVRPKEEILLEDGCRYGDGPSVEYRGIFINDEEELEHWVQRYMDEDTIGVKTYEKIFELLLRLKLNYIWPAMHVNSFNANRDNGALAEKMGIVVGTSHCDMLMRSNNREWKPWLAKKGYEGVEYDYSIPGRNREILEEYWRESVQQNRDFEVSYTLGMRGIHDSGFETRSLQGLAGKELLNAKIELLSTVIAAQERILSENLAEESLKIFVPYKEVLELYDNGLEVPEDLTLIWVNDNYGYVRRYPGEKEKARRSGNGIYYHNSYWAPPGESYLFVCTIPMAQTRNELKKAYREGIRKLWVTNFGAMKPLEQQMSFYAALAWECGRENAATDDEVKWLQDFLNRTFSVDISEAFAKKLVAFDQLVNTHKLEQMDSDVFSQTVYGNEAADRMYRLKELFDLANAVYDTVPAEEKDGFFQMVLMRIHAAYFTNAMYYYADKSNRCFGTEASAAAISAREMDEARRAMIYYYNRVMSNGKWNGILTPEDFPPPRTAMYPAIVPPIDRAILTSWTAGASTVERGRSALGRHTDTPTGPKTDERILLEDQDAVLSGDWHLIPNLGRDHGALMETLGSGILSFEFVIPRSECRQQANTGAPGGTIPASWLLELHRFPSLNSVGQIRVGVILDDGEERILESVSNDEYRGNWRDNTRNQVDRLYLLLPALLPGKHCIRLKALDPYFAFSRIVLYPVESECLSAAGGDLEEIVRRTPMSNLGIRPLHGEEPEVFDAIGFVRRFYGEAALQQPPRPILIYSDAQKDDCLALQDDQILSESERVILSDEMQERAIREILQSAQTPFAEEEGRVLIHTASALAETESAHSVGSVPWEYCSSPSMHGNAIALHVRKPGLVFERENAPGASYQVRLSGGTYRVWARVFLKSNVEAHMEIWVDDVVFSEEDLMNGTPLWRYSNEQVWKWMPLKTLSLEKGIHTIGFRCLRSRLRVEQLALEKLENDVTK